MKNQCLREIWEIYKNLEFKIQYMKINFYDNCFFLSYHKFKKENMDYVFKLIGLEDICIFGNNYLSLRHRQNFPNELYMAIFITSYIISSPSITYRNTTPQVLANSHA